MLRFSVIKTYKEVIIIITLVLDKNTEKLQQKNILT